MRRFGTQMNCAVTSGLARLRNLSSYCKEQTSTPTAVLGGKYSITCSHINFALAAVRTSTSHRRGLSNFVNGSCTLRKTAVCMFMPVTLSWPGRIVASLR